MPAWMIQYGYHSYTDGYTYCLEPMSWHHPPTQVEAESQMIARDSYTWDRMHLNIHQNNMNNNTVFKSRINGVDGNQTVTVGAGLTGFFEDNVNSDALVTGNLFCTEADTTASTFGNMSLGLITYRLTTVANTTPIIGGAQRATISDQTTRYFPLMGKIDDTGTESDVQYTFRVAATLYNMWFYVTTNTLDGIADVTLRINGAGGNLTVAVGAGTTGAFEDAANNDVIASGNNVNYQCVAAGSTGTIYIDTICIKSDSDGRQTANTYLYGSQGDSQTYYYTVEGDFTGMVEGNTQSEARTDLTATNGFLRVRTNTLDGAAVYTLRKNGANTAISMTVGAGLTGAFEDFDSVSYLDTDLINWMVVTAGSTGTISHTILGFEQRQPTAAPGAIPSICMSNKLIADRII